MAGRPRPWLPISTPAARSSTSSAPSREAICAGCTSRSSTQTRPTIQAQAGMYRSLLASRSMLIVLDNARDAGQVRPLLPGKSACMVVVTSRDKLAGLVAADEACPLSVDVLPHPDAAEMLAR